MNQVVARTGVKKESGYLYFMDRDGDVARSPLGDDEKREKVARAGVQRESGWIYYVNKDGDIARQSMENLVQDTTELEKKITQLLKEKAVKMPASDIDAFLKYQNVDQVKEVAEAMYHNGKISRTANYRYFILTEEKKKPKKASVSKSQAVDVKAELKKYKEMLDDDLITQEAYDAKMNQLLGL